MAPSPLINDSHDKKTLPVIMKSCMQSSSNDNDINENYKMYKET